MENKVSDNVIEKNYRECLKFNEINESKVDNFDLATAKAALENASIILNLSIISLIQNDAGGVIRDLSNLDSSKTLEFLLVIFD